MRTVPVYMSSFERRSQMRTTRPVHLECDEAAVRTQYGTLLRWLHASKTGQRLQKRSAVRPCAGGEKDTVRLSKVI